MTGVSAVSARGSIPLRIRINDPCARTLELPLSVRSGAFFFFLCLGGLSFGVFFAPFPEEEISDYGARIVYESSYGTAISSS